MTTQQPSNPSVSTETAKAIVTGFIARVINHLLITFPASAEKSSEEKKLLLKVWGRALANGGIHSYEMADGGLQKAELFPSKWMCSPGEFVQWCKDAQLEAMKIPSEYDIYKQLVNYQGDKKVRLNKFAFWCWREMDTNRFKTSRVEAAERYFSKIYQKMIEQALAGAEFTEQPLALEEQIFTLKTEEEVKLAKEKMKKIKEMVNA